MTKRIDKLLLLSCAQYNLKESVHELLKRGLAAHEVDENVIYIISPLFYLLKGNNMLMVAYESGNIDLLEAVINEYSLYKALNQKNKKGDNLILRSIKDQNEQFTHFLLQNQNVEVNFKDEVIYFIYFM